MAGNLQRVAQPEALARTRPEQSTSGTEPLASLGREQPAANRLKPLAIITIPAAAHPHPRLLLLGLVAARPTPANLAAVARLFRVSRPTARAWRDALLRAGLVEKTGAGFLAIVPATFDRWRAEQAQLLAAAGRSWRAGTLPAALLAVGRGHRGRRLPPAQLLAAAVLIGEARRERHGVASDSELAARAGCSRNTLRAARAALAAAALVLVRRVRRGRGRMIAATCSPTCWATAMAGSATMLRLAERHRRGARRRGNGLNSPLTPQRDSQKQRPIKAGGASGRSGQGSGRDRHAAIGPLLAGLGVQLAATRKQATPPPTWIGALLRPDALARLAKRSPVQGVVEVLRAAQVYERAPRRRDAAAGVLAHRLGKQAAIALVAVLADVLLDRPRNVGALLAWRCGELARGANPITRRGVPWGQLIADARQAVSA